MTDFTFADPPPRPTRGRPRVWRERADEARKHPGRWLRWEYPTKSKAGPNRAMIRKSLDASVEVEVRKIDGRWFVFLRAPGEAPKPRAVPNTLPRREIPAPELPKGRYACSYGCGEAFDTRGAQARHHRARHASDAEPA